MQRRVASYTQQVPHAQLHLQDKFPMEQLGQKTHTCIICIGITKSPPTEKGTIKLHPRCRQEGLSPYEGRYCRLTHQGTGSARTHSLLLSLFIEHTLCWALIQHWQTDTPSHMEFTFKWDEKIVKPAHSDGKECCGAKQRQRVGGL